MAAGIGVWSRNCCTFAFCAHQEASPCLDRYRCLRGDGGNPGNWPNRRRASPAEHGDNEGGVVRLREKSRILGQRGGDWRQFSRSHSNIDRRPVFSCMRGESHAIHPARHLDVGEQKLDVLPAGPEDGDRPRRVFRLHDDETGDVEGRNRQHSLHHLIFDNENDGCVLRFLEVCHLSQLQVGKKVPWAAAPPHAQPGAAGLLWMASISAVRFSSRRVFREP
jgi:hypothetical protein